MADKALKKNNIKKVALIFVLFRRALPIVW